ncbi:MAG: hypothetical protein K0R68_1047 [Mycobacterium sp.]|nr:hypothetical protein [Mycobacterium sp.]
MESIVALVITGPLVGMELAVAAVVNPLAARLPDSGFRVVRSGGSRWLGAAMPVWYAATLLALGAAAFITGRATLLAAVALMVGVLVLTFTVLVPINSRVGRWTRDGDVDRALTRRWDTFHWVRVALLAVVLGLTAVSV